MTHTFDRNRSVIPECLIPSHSRKLLSGIYRSQISATERASATPQAKLGGFTANSGGKSFGEGSINLSPRTCGFPLKACGNDSRFLFGVLSPLVFVFLVAGIVLNPLAGFSEEATQKSSGTLVKLEAEILEVEELSQPRGSAIYTVKDLSSGQTLRLFADPYRALIRVGGSTKTAGDVLGGTKATIIYRESAGEKMPEVVFAKVTSTYYS